MIMFANGMAFGVVKEVGPRMECPNGDAVSLVLECKGGGMVAFVAYRKNAQVVDGLREGDLVEIEFHPFSREYRKRDGSPGYHTTLGVDCVTVCARADEYDAAEEVAG